MSRPSLRRVLRGSRAAFSVLFEPPYAPPRHFYSPLSGAADVDRAKAWKTEALAGLDMAEADQLELLRGLRLEWPGGPRWAPNDMYGPLDAAFLVSLVRHFGIRTIIEVGSGYSSAAVLDGEPSVDLTCIDPYAGRLRSRLLSTDQVRVLECPVQDVPIEYFKQLSANQLLFIDSTHVVKAGSDVVYLLLKVLPVLRSGVFVHVHDIHWPFEYPDEWLDERRDWTEVYLLRALLTDTSAWDVIMCTSWIVSEHADLVPPELRGQPTGSLWLRRR